MKARDAVRLLRSAVSLSRRLPVKELQKQFHAPGNRSLMVVVKPDGSPAGPQFENVISATVMVTPEGQLQVLNGYARSLMFDMAGVPRSLERGKPAPDVVAFIDAKTLADLASGRTDFTTAFFNGRLQVYGDAATNFAVRLDQIWKMIAGEVQAEIGRTS